MFAPPLNAPNRNSVTTIRSDGSRAFLFPADVRGRFTTARKWTSFALIAFYLSLPWIKVGGYPAVFLDVAGRRFHLFGLTLAPQDVWLLFFLITGLGFALFFLTALLGRVWCGWACPHSVFLDQVYRRIERWIEGDAAARRQLRAAPWGAAKILRAATKHGLYVLVSAVITHLFLAYFLSLPEVWSMIRAAPVEHWTAFGFIVVATGALYFNFAWFREQMCIVICPYGRIQSALIDDHSLVIGYDTKRGEPRGRIRQDSGPWTLDPGLGNSSGRNVVYSYRASLPGSQASSEIHQSRVQGPGSRVQPAPIGDCVECARCVQVCPTGIDIRQGLQMECIGCTACIDACDTVMDKLNRPRGLIRYDSQKAFTGARTRWIRTRTIVYGVLMFAGASVATWAGSTVKPANFGVTRMMGAPYIVDAASVRNQFLVRVVNKRHEPARFRIHLEEAPSGLRVVGCEGTFEVAPLGEVVRPLVLQQARAAYKGPFGVEVRLEGEKGKFHLERKIEFVGPEARLLHEEEEGQHERREEQHEKH